MLVGLLVCGVFPLDRNAPLKRKNAATASTATTSTMPSIIPIAVPPPLSVWCTSRTSRTRQSSLSPGHHQRCATGFTHCHLGKRCAISAGVRFAPGRFCDGGIAEEQHAEEQHLVCLA